MSLFADPPVRHFGINGGSIYGIIGICWAVVYLITKVLNFATGEFVMLGGMLTWGLHAAGLRPPACLSHRSGATIVIAIVIERVAIRPVRFPSEMTYMMITIALASVIKGVVMLKWGTETRKIEPFFGSGVIHLFGAAITPQVIGVLGFLAVVTLGLHWFFRNPLIGKALRASAVNQTGAKLIGININRFRLLCFGLGRWPRRPDRDRDHTGDLYGLRNRHANRSQGVGGCHGRRVDIGGTVIAALILGLLEGFCAGFVSTGFKDVLALVAMMVFLIVKTYRIAPKARRT